MGPNSSPIRFGVNLSRIAYSRIPRTILFGAEGGIRGMWSGGGEKTALGIVEPILKVPQRRVKRSGPMPRVWGLVGHCSDEEVARAVILHYRTLSPKYRAAEKVAQAILDDFYKKGKPMEISIRDIFVQVKALKIPFTSPDIADLAAMYLHEKGVKVWR